jgi:hypothetical protein
MAAQKPVRNRKPRFESRRKFFLARRDGGGGGRGDVRRKPLRLREMRHEEADHVEAVRGRKADHHAIRIEDAVEGRRHAETLGPSEPLSKPIPFPGRKSGQAA